MRAKTKAAGLRTRAARKTNLNNHLTARLSVTKYLPVDAHGLDALMHWAALYGPPDKTKPRDLGREGEALKSKYETKSITVGVAKGGGT